LSVDLAQLQPEQIAQLQTLLSTIPAKPDEPPKRKPRKQDTIKYLSEEQLDRFFSVIQKPRDLAIFRVIYHRGLRASEVGRLQLSDWNRERDRIRLFPAEGVEWRRVSPHVSRGASTPRLAAYTRR